MVSIEMTEFIDALNRGDEEQVKGFCLMYLHYLGGES
jgi:hypothetical protein